jgi:hypothetical protein
VLFEMEENAVNESQNDRVSSRVPSVPNTRGLSINVEDAFLRNDQ